MNANHVDDNESLPHEFDLLYDIKTVGDLKRRVAWCASEVIGLIDSMHNHGIVLEKEMGQLTAAAVMVRNNAIEKAHYAHARLKPGTHMTVTPGEAYTWQAIDQELDELKALL